MACALFAVEIDCLNYHIIIDRNSMNEFRMMGAHTLQFDFDRWISAEENASTWAFYQFDVLCFHWTVIVESKSNALWVVFFGASGINTIIALVQIQKKNRSRSALWNKMENIMFQNQQDQMLLFKSEYTRMRTVIAEIFTVPHRRSRCFYSIILGIYLRFIQNNCHKLYDLNIEMKRTASKHDAFRCVSR